MDRPRKIRGVALAAAAGLAGLTLAACSSSPSTKGAASTTSTAKANAAACPLTGAPPPDGGNVPQRPALAIKVDNYPNARPQSGIDHADIVYEEPVEGGITRYVAVFQCQGAPLVGPIRSARNIDIGILGQFGSPLLVHVGGITPVLDNIEASPLVNLDLGNYASVIVHPSGRVAPYSTYASTASLWALKSGDATVPSPVFGYTGAAPTGTSAGTVAIPFSGTANVVWHWDAAKGVYVRDYGTSPDVLADGHQVSATNVVVQTVHLTYGPWAENSEGGLEVQANLYQDASGPAMVFRHGTEVTGSWSRNALGQPTSFTTSSGATIDLSPGNTWVELVPDTVTVTVSPSSS